MPSHTSEISTLQAIPFQSCTKIGQNAAGNPEYDEDARPSVEVETCMHDTPLAGVLEQHDDESDICSNVKHVDSGAEEREHMAQAYLRHPRGDAAVRLVRLVLLSRRRPRGRVQRHRIVIWVLHSTRAVQRVLTSGLTLWYRLNEAAYYILSLSLIRLTHGS